jgi:hypothetical protein
LHKEIKEVITKIYPRFSLEGYKDRGGVRISREKELKKS